MSGNKFTRKPKAPIQPNSPSRYERYNLRENPFPASPFINPDSSDMRANGEIYEPLIRTREYEQIKQNFLSVPQADSNHLRLGYILDTSYIGRGNGKSAFIINLQRQLNQDYCLNISNGYNKCFVLTVIPETGGKTKTFDSFVELFVEAIFRSDIITDSLIALRLTALSNLVQDFEIDSYFEDEADLRNKVNSEEWYRKIKVDYRSVDAYLAQMPELYGLPPEFPVVSRNSLFPAPSNQQEFEDYYKSLRRGKQQLEFLFSHLVRLFIAAGFNGAYVFVDDFERIPDFQSQRQKREFAQELRSCLFDGLYVSARTGFYVTLLVLHAGVPRLIEEAWSQSGLEQRAPMNFKSGVPRHIIRFEKLTPNDTKSLIRKYIEAYQIDPQSPIELFPFQSDALDKMAELTEFNASKILKLAYELLERAADNNVSEIDLSFVSENDATINIEHKPHSGIHDAPTKNLQEDCE